MTLASNSILKLLRLFLLPALCLALTPYISADAIVYNNGGPNQHNGNEMSDFLQSEDFTLGALTLITDVHFWNLQLVAGDYKGLLYWEIDANSGGAPGAILASGNTSSVTRAATGLTDSSGTYSEFTNDFNITATLLGPGTYWLSLHDGALSDTEYADFYWEWSADNGNGFEKDLVGGGSESNLADHAFYLTGELQQNVPEPGSAVLLFSGLAGLVLRRFSFARRH